MITTNQIPTIKSDQLEQQSLEQALQFGCCYWHIDDESVFAKIKSAIEFSNAFFEKEDAYKNQWTDIGGPEALTDFAGYAKRQTGIHYNEQFFFNPKKPVGPFCQISDFVSWYHTYVLQEILQPLSTAICQSLQLPEKALKAINYEPTCSLTFQHYPHLTTTSEEERFLPHKDFGTMTVLYFNQSGLQFLENDTWHDISVKESCLFINFGNTLEKMTQGQCRSAVHRVTQLNKKRTSLVFFIQANDDLPIYNYVDDSLVCPSGKAFFELQFKQLYQ